MGERDFDQFKQKVKQKTGIDLHLYKEQQMKRRMTSFREKKGFSTFAAFFEGMMEDEHLFHEFLERMTINVSEFYRNPEKWAVLEKTILPSLLRNKKSLKVWSAASSTGEEPYSLVMLLSQFMPLTDIHVRATDIDESAIAKAKEGKYVQRSIQHVPRHHVRRYFRKEGAFYVLQPEVKARVHFRRHNLLADPFESEHDLIICRNVLIYFTEEAKHILYQKFARALLPGGVFFVGSTEQIFHPEQYGLESIEPFFYRKKIVS